jgi:protein-S-isoprenylcysteine O-methyltransferase Ste14
MALDDDKSRRPTLRKSALLLVVCMLFLAVIMFLPAGMHWLLAVFFIYTVLSSWYLWRVNPEIFIARSKIHEGTKSWDRVLMALLLVSLFAVFLVARFDARFGWSLVSTPLIAVGYFLFTLGFVASVWVYAVNKFAEPSVRIQTDRAQKVIDTSPYAIVRHPLYAAAVVLMAGGALALGSYWTLATTVVGTLIVSMRIVLEDRTLQNELEGYEAYASRVRYRLVPACGEAVPPPADQPR